MSTSHPPTRRRFAGDWDEIEYLYRKLLYWFCEREDRRRAAAFCDRLEPLLNQVSPDDKVIVGEECRSLICEVRGDLGGAIRHRENEIRLIKRLHRISLNTPSRNLALSHYDFSDLSERLDLLAALYHEAGDLDRAIRILKESKQLCEKRGIRFESPELLRHYLRERGAHRPLSRSVSN
jgi:hypothetical protein